MIGAPVRSHDSRRWQNEPHLSVSLAYVRDMFEYLYSRDIHFYRLAGQLAPYVTHPDLPAFHHQIEECGNELAMMGDLARQYRIRLSMHPAHYIQLSSPDAERVARSCQELTVAAALFDAMGLGGALRDEQPICQVSAAALHHIGVIGNDLVPAAVALAPVIADVLGALRADKTVLYAGLSGSGATCFALLGDLNAAQALREKLSARHEAWWVCATRLGGA